MTQKLNFLFRELLIKVNYKPIKNYYLRARGGCIEVSSPMHKSKLEIEDLLKLYYARLKQKLIQQAPETSDDLLGIHLLGVNYPISHKKIIKSENSIAIVNDVCEIYSSTTITIKMQQQLIQNLHRQVSSELFPKLLKERFTFFAQRGYDLPKLSIKTMRSRWGSYSKHTHRIHLNMTLIQLDMKLIDYVVVHELCHLIEQNHSSRFYALMNNFLPNWRDLRNQLNQFSSILR